MSESLTRIPWLRRQAAAWNGDRLYNRVWRYPVYLRRIRRQFDLFHVCDHSYSQLIHELLTSRTGVFCHDLDTFRCLLEPAADPRPEWFRAIARRALKGFQKAAVVFHTTNTVRTQIERHGLIDPKRLIQAPYGVSAEFHSIPQEDSQVNDLLAPLGGAPFVLHVGSCIPRKRVDVLLRILAELGKQHRDLQLVQVGGDWTSAHRDLIRSLGMAVTTTGPAHHCRPVSPR